ncbi:MAG TPA: hypothetical protein VNP96_13215 [Solirubrobacterales bacterium]|nr:hypothetical protein [Solirubrobacterales bacterium]
MDPQLKRALSQAVRVEILERIAARPASPRQIAALSGEPLGKVAYHTTVLCLTGCIRPAEPADSDPGERVYEVATLMPAPPRLALSESTRNHLYAAILRRIVESGSIALEAGTLGNREGDCISCESVVFDPQGWREARAIVDEATEQLAAARSATAKRLARSGEPGIAATIALAAFETPPDSRPAGAA